MPKDRSFEAFLVGFEDWFRVQGLGFRVAYRTASFFSGGWLEDFCAVLLVMLVFRGALIMLRGLWGGVYYGYNGIEVYAVYGNCSITSQLLLLLLLYY